MTPGTLVDGGVELHVDLLDLLVAGRPALLAALFFLSSIYVPWLHPKRAAGVLF